MESYKEMHEADLSDKVIHKLIKVVTSKVRNLPQTAFIGKYFPIKDFKKLIGKSVSNDDFNIIVNGVMGQIAYFKKIG